MAKFNLKTAKLEDQTINEKKLESQRNEMGTSNEKQDVVGKNINFSISKKDKDNTIPFNVQLESSRKNKENEKIVESKMDKKEVSFGEKTEQVSSINRESQKYDTEKIEKFKKAQEYKDTAFWDKYIGVQMEGETTKVDSNISSSQLQNSPERFKGDKTKKMVSALKDADAMLFHIHASAKKEGREISSEEKQQIIDINSGKRRIFSESCGSAIVRESRDIAKCRKCNIKWDVRGIDEDATCPNCNNTVFIGNMDDYE